MQFKEGDRVQMNPEHADSYIEPWPKRIRKGMFGTVERVSQGRYMVQFDKPKRAKYLNDWFWTGLRDKDLLPA